VHEAISGARAQVEKRNLVAELRGQQNKALAEEDYESAEQINQRLEDTKLMQEHQIADTALKAVSLIPVYVYACHIIFCQLINLELTIHSTLYVIDLSLGGDVCGDGSRRGRIADENSDQNI